MKKITFFTMLASLLLFAGCFESNAVFSVSPTRQVRFAKGNVEYDSIDGYRFAAHQYDYGGYFDFGGCDSTEIGDYFPYFSEMGDHIIVDKGPRWRTLTEKEWSYVIGGRANASAKCGGATVCGVHGMVLLPDSCLGENNFHAGFDEGWNTNVYDTSSWLVMEATGAVFLPAAGEHDRTEMDGVGEIGCYRTASGCNDEGVVYGVYFNKDGVINVFDGWFYWNEELSVRLVQDI